MKGQLEADGLGAVFRKGQPDGLERFENLVAQRTDIDAIEIGNKHTAGADGALLGALLDASKAIDEIAVGIFSEPEIDL